MTSSFFAAYTAVLLAEVVGDKTFFTVGALAPKYRTVPLLVGATIGVCLKMGAAVAVGELVAKLPKGVVSGLSCTAFLVLALRVWMKPPATPTGEERQGGWRPAMVAFASIALTEWADAGQLAAAVVAAELRRPMAVWLGASAAMVTKVTLALALGGALRRLVPARVVRVITTATCVVMAAMAVLGFD